MAYLLDTHILLWAASAPDRLSGATQAIIADVDQTLYFSAASIWEIAIKSGLGRADFQVDAAQFRSALLENGYVELPINSEHAAQVAILPPLHKDPFDRMLIAQAHVETVRLITADALVLQYGSPTQRA